MCGQTTTTNEVLDAHRKASVESSRVDSTPMQQVWECLNLAGRDSRVLSGPDPSVSGKCGTRSKYLVGARAAQACLVLGIA